MLQENKNSAGTAERAWRGQTRHAKRALGQQAVPAESKREQDELRYARTMLGAVLLVSALSPLIALGAHVLRVRRFMNIESATGADQVWLVLGSLGLLLLLGVMSAGVVNLARHARRVREYLKAALALLGLALSTGAMVGLNRFETGVVGGGKYYALVALGIMLYWALSWSLAVNLVLVRSPQVSHVLSEGLMGFALMQSLSVGVAMMVRYEAFRPNTGLLLGTVVVCLGIGLWGRNIAKGLRVEHSE